MLKRPSERKPLLRSPSHDRPTRSGWEEESQMSEGMSPVPGDHPLMIAWTAYMATPEYANTKKWAMHAEHTEGSLWAAFVEGCPCATP